MSKVTKRNYVKKHMDRMYKSYRHDEGKPKADRKLLKLELNRELRGLTL